MWWVVFTAALFRLGGVRVPAFAVYIVITFIAGLVLGARGGFAMAGLSMLAGISLYYAETNGLIRYGVAEGITAASALSIHIALLGVAAQVLYLYMTQINRAIGALARSNRNLRDSRQHLQDLYRNAPIAYFTVSADGLIRQCNQAALQLLAYQHPQDLLGRPVIDLYADTPQGKEKAAVLLQRFRAGKPIWAEDVQMQKADGALVWASITVNAVKDAAGQVVESRSMVVDITDRKQAEAALRTEALQNEQILQTMLDGFILADTEGQLLKVNPAYCRIIGYSEAELLGMNIRQLEVAIPPAEVERRIEQMVSQGADRFETQHRRKDGQVIDLNVSIVIMQTAAAPLVAAFVHDITGRNRAEAEIRRNLARAESLNRAAAAVNKAESLDEVYDAIIENIHLLLPYDACVILIADGGRAVAVRAIDRRSGDIKRGKLFGTLSLAIDTTRDLQQMAATRAALIIEDTRAYEGWVLNPETEWVRSTAGAPIFAGDRLFGFVIAYGAQPGKFNRQEGAYLEGFAGLAGTAIHKIKLFGETKKRATELERRAHELTSLNALGRDAGLKLSIADVVSAGMQGILETVRPDLAFFFLREGERLILKGAAPHDNADAFGEVPEHRVGECMCGLAVRQKKALYSQDIFNDLRCTWEECKKAGLRSFAALPLRSGQDVIGVIGLSSKEERDFESQAEFLETIANTVAISLSNALLYEQIEQYAAELERKVAARTADLQQQYRRQAALAEVELAINRPHQLQAVLDRIADVATKLLPASGGASVILYNEQTDTFDLSASTVPDQPLQTGAHRVRRKGGASHWIVEHRRPMIVSDVRHDPFGPNRMLPDFGLQAYAGVPMLAEGKAIGVLYALERRPREYSWEEIDFLTALAGRAAVAVTKVQLYQQLEAAKEKAETADRLKSAFLATMSHELRTPLNSIIGFTGIMLQRLVGHLNDEQTRQLGMVQNSARHLLDLINDVLDISKIEAGQLQVTCEPFDMRRSIEHVVQAAGPLVQKKKLTLAVDIDPQVNRIDSDRRRVEQILLNLVNNALKFTDRGEVRIECRVDNDQMVTRVADTGMGIKPEDMDKLFEAFRQIETGLTRRHDGTGLGLAICQKLLTLLGGDIQVESEWGAGSAFTFTLPLKKG
ncbi:MAG: GAF domain-containing protein [Anaerolineae bacterium]